ncbi:hypothetical protein HAX54_028956, partial [Datura stramonium]|nr:hypothetical protein [Datura stramonium]
GKRVPAFVEIYQSWLVGDEAERGRGRWCGCCVVALFFGLEERKGEGPKVSVTAGEGEEEERRRKSGNHRYRR